MRLYHHPMSSNARRAVMTALHLDVPVELKVIDMRLGQQREPSYLALNPNGKVPVLEDGDFVLWESHAIMQYLADKTPGQSLYPTELRARADVNRWLFWSAHHFQPAISVLTWERVVKRAMNAGPADPAELARGNRLVDDVARVLDGHLEGRTWLAGERLSLADLAVAAPLMYVEASELPVKGRANLMAWFGRVQALDGWKKTAL